VQAWASHVGILPAAASVEGERRQSRFGAIIELRRKAFYDSEGEFDLFLEAPLERALFQRPSESRRPDLRASIEPQAANIARAGRDSNKMHSIGAGRLGVARSMRALERGRDETMTRAQLLSRD
jgi:hypothetical protein